MKLRNKKTGEIIELLSKPSFVKRNDEYLQSEVNTFNSLAELNEEWEDYDEPKYIWYLDWKGNIHSTGINNDWKCEKEIGNYFETEEEAEKAAEKLKAWKRLKDKKIFIWLDHFDYRSQDGSFNVEFGDNLSSDELNQVNDDLDLLFGGEE